MCLVRYEVVVTRLQLEGMKVYPTKLERASAGLASHDETPSSVLAAVSPHSSHVNSLKLSIAST